MRTAPVACVALLCALCARCDALQVRHPGVRRHPRHRAWALRGEAEDDNGDKGPTGTAAGFSGLMERIKKQMAAERSARTFPPDLDDPRLVYGDMLALTAVALLHAIYVIVLDPTFPGWDAPVPESAPHLGETLLRAMLLIFSYLVGFGYNNALFSGAARDSDTAVNIVAKAGIDMTNVHILVLLIVNVLFLHQPINPNELGFDVMGSFVALAMWRALYSRGPNMYY